MTHRLINSWFPGRLESFILPGDSDKTFVWWHRNESLCWTTLGIMREVTSMPETRGTFPVGPGGLGGGGGVKPDIDQTMQKNQDVN